MKLRLEYPKGECVTIFGSSIACQPILTSVYFKDELLSLGERVGRESTLSHIWLIGLANCDSR